MDTKINKRASWEKEVASKYGIDPTRDRDFFDEVWAEEDNSSPFGSLFEFELFVKNSWRFYERGREQAGQSVSYVISGEGIGQPLKRNGQSSTEHESSKGPGVGLGEKTGARISAFSEYLAKIAACDKRVMRLRERICGGVTRTLPPEKALEFLEAHSVKGVKVLIGHEDTLPWPDGSASGRHFRVQEGSVLEDLRDAAAYFKKHYPWSIDQAANFILCDITPRAGVITGGHKRFINEGVAAHKYNRTTVKLEIDSWVSPDEVRKAYLQIQHKAHNDNHGGLPPLQGPRKHPAPRNLAVFRFVVSQSYIEVIDSEHRLGRIELPRWRSMLESWNSSLSHDGPWRYSDVRNFQRDFHRAQLVVIGTGEGLPGVPGQPMTMDQLEEMQQRLLESNERMNERRQREKGGEE